MTTLDIILAIKIAGTGMLVALPFLLLPGSRLTSLLKIGEEAMPLVRLYGVAVLALLVGYCFGFSAMTGDSFPTAVATVGLVSNGGAAATMLLTGRWRQARAMTLFLGAIALSLGYSLLQPAQVMMPL